VEKLEDRLETLEREMKSATLDYLDLYAKAKKLFGRLAKAMDRAEESEASAVAPDNGGGVAASQLSGRAAEAQRRILARRARMITGGPTQ